MSGIQRPITLSAIQAEFSQNGQVLGRGNSLEDYRGILAFDNVSESIVRLPRENLSFSDFENRSWYPTWEYQGASVTITNQPQSQTGYYNSGSVEFLVRVNISTPPSPTDSSRPGIVGPTPRLGPTTYLWQVKTVGSSSWQTLQTTETYDDFSTLRISMNDPVLANILNLDSNQYRCIVTSTVIAQDEVTGNDIEVAETQVTSNAALLNTELADFDAPEIQIGSVVVDVRNPIFLPGNEGLYRAGEIKIGFSNNNAGVDFASAAPGRTITNQTSSVTWEVSYNNGSSWTSTLPSGWTVLYGFFGIIIQNVQNDDLDGVRVRAQLSASQTQSPPTSTKTDSATSNQATIFVDPHVLAQAQLDNFCPTNNQTTEGGDPLRFTVRTSNLGLVQFEDNGTLTFSVTNNSGRFDTGVPYTTTTRSRPGGTLIAGSLVGELQPNYFDITVTSDCPRGDNGSRISIGPFPKLNKYIPEVEETIVVQTPGAPYWYDLSGDNIVGQTGTLTFDVYNEAPTILVTEVQTQGGGGEISGSADVKFLPNSNVTLEIAGTNFPEDGNGEAIVDWAITNLDSGFLTSPTSGNVTCTFTGPDTTGIYYGTITLTADDYTDTESGTLRFNVRDLGGNVVAFEQLSLGFVSNKSTYSVNSSTDWVFSPSSGNPSPGTYVTVGDPVSVQFARSGSTQEVVSVSVLSDDDSQAPPTTIKELRANGLVDTVIIGFDMPDYPVVVYFDTNEPDYPELSVNYSPCGSVSETFPVDCGSGLSANGTITVSAPAFFVSGGSDNWTIQSQSSNLSASAGITVDNVFESNSGVTVEYTVNQPSIGPGELHVASIQAEFSVTVEDTVTGNTATTTTTCTGYHRYQCDAIEGVIINAGGSAPYVVSPSGNFTVNEGSTVVLEIFAPEGTADPVITTACGGGPLVGSNGYWTYTFTAPANGCAFLATASSIDGSGGDGEEPDDGGFDPGITEP